MVWGQWNRRRSCRPQTSGHRPFLPLNISHHLTTIAHKRIFPRQTRTYILYIVYTYYTYFVRNVNSAANPAAARRRIASSLARVGSSKGCCYNGTVGYAIPWVYARVLPIYYKCITKLRILFYRMCSTPSYISNVPTTAYYRYLLIIEQVVYLQESYHTILYRSKIQDIITHRMYFARCIV